MGAGSEDLLLMKKKNLSFGLLSEIKIDDPETFEDKIFLTLDVDWAHDEVFADSIDFLRELRAKATWFVTHETAILDDIRDDPNFELGIHPNFNPLLDGSSNGARNATEVIDDVLKIVPEAKCVRSHSMSQNFRLLDLFSDRGLTHDSNDFIPEQSGMELLPYPHWTGLLRVPFFWEDNVQCMYRKNSSICDLVNRNGLKIFNFHPIHVFLNTEKLSRYENTRSQHYKPELLIKMRSNSSMGSREQLKQIIDQIHL